MFTVLRAWQEHGSEVSTSIAELLSKLEATRLERQEGEHFRRAPFPPALRSAAVSHCTLASAGFFGPGFE